MNNTVNTPMHPITIDTLRTIEYCLRSTANETFNEASAALDLLADRIAGVVREANVASCDTFADTVPVAILDAQADDAAAEHARDQHNGTIRCNGKLCSHESGKGCYAVNPATSHVCTRARGHTGPHIACGVPGDHDLCSWPNSDDTVRSTLLDDQADAAAAEYARDQQCPSGSVSITHTPSTKPTP